MNPARSSPFSPRVALGLVLAGALGFIGLLWSIGSGMADPAPQPSGAHVGGKGLTGFAALATYLKARDYSVSEGQTRGAQQRGGLLVLTPRHDARPADIARVIADHSSSGPTLLIMPKWLAQPLPQPPAFAPTGGSQAKVRPGFVRLVQAAAPEWRGFHDEIAVMIAPLAGSPAAQRWRAVGIDGVMPAVQTVESGQGRHLVPLVTAGSDARIVAAYLADTGRYPALDAMAMGPPAEVSEADVQTGRPGYPLILVFDPDLLNNYGFAQQANAVLAERIVQAALRGAKSKIVFDLTLAGYARSQSLLELAFTPPFLAATLCLVLAAGVALWRAYHRFGPPLLAGRSIAFGKRALIANAAGLLRRARRLHLLGGPYADAARERLIKALALPQRLDPAAAEAAIDRALAVRAPGSESFSATSADLRAARKPRDLLRAAQRLHLLERTLLR